MSHVPNTYLQEQASFHDERGPTMTRALIVVGQEEHLTPLCLLLLRHGSAVEAARDGAEALVKARSHPPDLVIADWHTSVMAGCTLLRHWKADDQLKAIPFVVLTATNTEPDVGKLALDLGAAAFMNTPFEPEPFMVCIHNVLAGQARRAPTPMGPTPAKAQGEEPRPELERLNRELAEREARLRAVFNAEPECVKLLAADGTILEMNPAGMRMIEADRPEQVIHQSIYPLVLEEHRTAVHNLTEKVFRGESGTVVFQIRGLKGGSRWLETHATPLRDAQGGITSLLGVTRDITDHRLAEAEKERERMLSNCIINSLPGIFYLFDSQGRFCRWNASFEQVSGYSSTELGQLHPLDLFIGVDKKRVQQRIQQVFEQGASEIEADLVAKNGARTPYFFTGVRISVEGQPHLVGLGLNITDRRRTEEVVRENERRLATLMANLPGMAYRCQNRPNWTMEFVSEGAADLTGWSPADLMGNRPSYGDLILPSDRQPVWEAVQAALDAREPFELTYQIRAANGQIKSVWERGRGVFAPDGSLLFLEGFVSDISERRRAEERIRQLNRIYAVLGNINQLIVRESLPQAILDGACRIAVEKGGFLLAWVGLVDAPTGRLSLAAHAGATPDTLAVLDRVFSDPALGCAFTTAVLINGGHAACNDIAQDPRATPWRAEALGRGYRAMASFALVVAGQRIGTFNLYAGTSGFFDADELRLLDELAVDIAFALEISQREGLRHRAETARDVLLELETKLSAARDPVAAARCIFAAADKLWAFDAAALDVYLPAQDLTQTVLTLDLIAGERREVSVLQPLDEPSTRFRRILEGGAELILRPPPFTAGRDSHMFGDTSRPSASILCVPIRWQERPVGVMSIQSYAPNAFTQGDLRALQGLADHCGGTLERIRADDALRASEARFRQLAENIQEVFWIAEPARDQIHYVSPAFEKIWGRTCASLYATPQTWTDAIHHEDRDRVRMATLTKQTRGEYDETYRIIRPDGTVRWIHDRAFPVRDPVGDILRVVGTAEDITETRRLEEQFLQSQKMEAIGLLAGGVAHDFNNILAAMMMQVDTAAQPPDLPAETREMLRDLKSSIERAADLTRQLLAFGRRQVMRPRSLDLNDSVTNLTKMLLRILGEDVRLQLNLQPVPLITRADPGMLDQVLLNLVVNARDAMPGGGQLFIETSERTLAEPEAHAIHDVAPGRYVCLRVTDTGSGIQPEVLPHIFEPFFTTKEPGRGTGLGLATVFGIVKQHRGVTLVNSNPGRGTTFEILLASAETPTGTGVAPAAKSLGPGGTETILLVEDESSVRKSTLIVLRRAGYTVLEAPHAIEAQRIWNEHEGPIHLLFTDMVMPEGVSGHELAKRLLAENPSLRVIFTSGYSADIAGQELNLRAGQNFIQKPCPPSELLETIRRCLDL